MVTGGGMKKRVEKMTGGEKDHSPSLGGKSDLNGEKKIN